MAPAVVTQPAIPGIPVNDVAGASSGIVNPLPAAPQIGSTFTPAFPPSVCVPSAFVGEKHSV